MSKKQPVRRRRNAEEARRVILDAAQKRLAERGPEAIRLQALAEDLGLSHPAILHHFGSREGLIEALERRAMEELSTQLLEPISTGQALDRVFSTLGDAGHARLLAWWMLRGSSPGPDPEAEPMLAKLATAFHAEREDASRERGTPCPPREDTEYAIRLAAVALFGEALIGPLLTQSAGLDDGAGDRFREWLTDLFENSIR